MQQPASSAAFPTLARASRLKPRAFAPLLLITGAAAVAAAAQLDPALKACAGLRNDSERLACYDRAVAHLDADEAGELAGNVAAAQAMFGMTDRVRSGRTAAAPEREEISSISARVQRLEQAADGSLLIALDNGQVWRQTDSKRLLLDVGDNVTISRAAMASFKLVTPHNRFARVTRVE